MGGDLHIPFQDDKAVSLFLKFIKNFEPDNIFLNGDVIDCWEISNFAKPTNIQTRMFDEIVQAKIFLNELRTIAPKANIIYIFGNHEFRFERFISKNAKELVGLDGLTLEEQLKLENFNIKAINSHQKENYYIYGKLAIAHFNRVNKHSGYTAKNLIEDKGISVIQNHTHRGGISYKRDFGDNKIGVENFCLCGLNPPYTAMPNWQQGFSAIHRETKSHFFKITPIEIIKKRYFFGDKIFS